MHICMRKPYAYFRRLSWISLFSVLKFVESLLWPLVDRRERPVIVVVIKLLSDESLLVLGLRVCGGSALLVGLHRHLHCNLDADLP